MIELVYSNRTERLLAALVERLEKRRRQVAHPLDPVELVVPNRNMETWVRLGIAQATGVAANLRFRRLERFVSDLVAEASGGTVRLADSDTLEAAILAVLLDDEAMSAKDLAPAREYLKSAAGPESEAGELGSSCQSARDQRDSARSSKRAMLGSDGADLRRVQLASRLAHLFQEYVFSRPEMMSGWGAGRREDGVRGRRGSSARAKSGRGTMAGNWPPTPFTDPSGVDPHVAAMVDWQRALWLEVLGGDGVLARLAQADGARWTTLDALVHDDATLERLREVRLPPIHVFGVSYVARLFQVLFARLGEIAQLHIYALNPCAEYWEDLETDRELVRRLKKDVHARGRRVWPGGKETEDADPFGLAAEETPALRHWGRPGREHVRLLGELTECDFTNAFHVPGDESSGVLNRLQRDILLREPRGAEQATDLIPPDETMRLVAAPSVRREVEWVADEIWRLVRDDRPAFGESPLRFSDIAVIVNSSGRDEYLPHIEAVFSASHGLPCSLSDLPAAAGSRTIEAMSLLLELPFGRFSRAEMLTFMCHPAVLGRFGDISPDDFARKAEELGIVFGADRSDHAGTYIDEDVFNWDQGIRRLALGAFMTGERGGDERIFEAGGSRLLVDELTDSGRSPAAHLGLLARSLIADARFARHASLPLSEWARFYAAQMDTYLHAAADVDERDRLRCLRAISKLESMDLGREVSGRIASKLALEALSGLGGGRGQYLAEGVVVSSFLPMRAIPFRVVFLLGLGEGRFPAASRPDALDLRAARRRAGDVEPAERDRYMFLETLLCARDRLYLSYVRRDEQTGDKLEPSAVVQELLHMLRRGYLGDDGVESLCVKPPLRRHDDEDAKGFTFMDESRVEAVARDLAESLPAEKGEGGAASYSRSVELLESAEGTMAPEAWEKLSAMLRLPGAPPRAASRWARASGSAGDGHIPLSIAALRRFLECPMQGWARVMLRMDEDDEDLADREEEDFEVGLLQSTTLLRESWAEASAKRRSTAELYDERVARLRLAGRFPVGSLGEFASIKHRDVLGAWSSALSTALGDEPTEEPAPLVPPKRLVRVRLGRSAGEAHSDLVIDPLVIDVKVSVDDALSLVPVRLGGRTEGLLEDLSVSVSFRLARQAPLDAVQFSRIFKLLLRGMLDHVVLSAAGVAPGRDRMLVAAMASSAEDAWSFAVGLRPMEREDAREWLADVAEDLLTGSHAHLMPCDAVFAELHESRKSARRGSKARGAASGGAGTADVAAEPGDMQIDPERLQRRIRDMADDERKGFSSLYGPVPSPRSYDPPSVDEIRRIVSRRFQPLLDLVVFGEDL